MLFSEDMNSKTLNENYLIAVEDIVMEFPGVRALDRISFELYPGEIHCLVGENGAGEVYIDEDLKRCSFSHQRNPAYR